MMNLLRSRGRLVMLRRLRCWFRGHDWNVTDHDQATQRVTRECSECGARRRYVSDPREHEPRYGYREGGGGFDGGI
jgi:hypothetical protein